VPPQPSTATFRERKGHARTSSLRPRITHRGHRGRPDQPVRRRSGVRRAGHPLPGQHDLGRPPATLRLTRSRRRRHLTCRRRSGVPEAEKRKNSSLTCRLTCVIDVEADHDPAPAARPGGAAISRGSDRGDPSSLRRGLPRRHVSRTEPAPRLLPAPPGGRPVLRFRPRARARALPAGPQRGDRARRRDRGHLPDRHVRLRDGVPQRPDPDGRPPGRGRHLPPRPRHGAADARLLTGQPERAGAESGDAGSRLGRGDRARLAHVRPAVAAVGRCLPRRRHRSGARPHRGHRVRRGAARGLRLRLSGDLQRLASERVVGIHPGGPAHLAGAHPPARGDRRSAARQHRRLQRFPDVRRLRHADGPVGARAPAASSRAPRDRTLERDPPTPDHRAPAGVSAAAVRGARGHRLPPPRPERITTVYVHVAVQGRSLYVELSTTALPPCANAYRIVDSVENTGSIAWLRAIGKG
jgi:hypothetical protein